MLRPGQPIRVTSSCIHTQLHGQLGQVVGIEFSRNVTVDMRHPSVWKVGDNTPRRRWHLLPTSVAPAFGCQRKESLR